ncbi:hypothetical protein A0H81_05937 [Grifola frondosa]|uniref:Major facilitator superfamily (MFS) profile domain-containing protein n=1 Tax=Grifola frondosa TaxID=5627 RepID=A0A1C7MAX1_GRIFR|nr:hypothetical protein A0H81_05937 [Grifola frondosa]
MSRDEEEATIADNEHHFALRSLDELSEPIDPRIRPSDRPDDEELDEGYARQLNDYIHHREHHHEIEYDLEKKPDETLYVEFDKGDKRDPVYFSKARKWAITLSASFFTLIVASSSAAYPLGAPSMTRDLNATQFQATIGLSLYALGFGVTPLVTASFSEEFGRQPLYLYSGIGCLLMHVMIALAKNIQTVLIGRFLAGAFGSTGSTMVGGTVADIWMSHERGVPMALFSVAALGGVGVGCVAGGWIEQNSHLGWRWIQWIHVILLGAFVAKKLRKDTGNHHYRARVEDERASLRTLIYISCTRPIYLLLTEPLVASFSLWVGFAWGILYALIESVAPAFKTLHGFNTGETGTIFVTVIISCAFGLLGNHVQEIFYRKYVATKGPEARLFSACFVAVLLPAGMFIYAWSTFSKVPWIAMAIGIVVIVTSLFILYVAVFTYLADCYGPFASSALAGQSLSRNLMGMAFPLFTEQMYAALTYHWGNSLFGFIAVLMIPIPYILMWKGPAVRARSKFASQVMK